MLGAEAAPDFSDPLGLIEACHGRIAAQCELLQKMVVHQNRHGADDELAAAARRVLRYFDMAAPLHHQDEEQDLFPALAGIADLQALIQHLAEEHQQHNALWQALREDLLKILEGRASDQLAAHSEPFIAAYLEHARIENEQILPRARKVLDVATLATLGKNMQRRRQVD